MKLKVTLLIILFLGFFLRIYGLNWDVNMHLHPDERFLTMVGIAAKLPDRISDYFNPQKSTLNPGNIGYNFFVYGNLPLTINKVLAVLWGNDNYNSFTLQGRCLSALADFFIIVVIYKLILLLEKKYHLAKEVKLFACFFYAISVLPIQLGHFFTVDSFLNLFMFSSFYFALKYSLKKQKKNIILSGVFFGLALACKVTAIFILPLNIYFLSDGERIFFKKKIDFKTVFINLLLLYFFVYISFRAGDPYKFSTNSWFNPTISSQYIDNLKSLKSFDNKDIWYPPGVQWMEKPAFIFALKNLVFYGVGIPYFLLIIIGCCFLFKKKYVYLQLVFAWAILFFVYQSIQHVKTMRYFIFLYPFLAIFAGIGLERLFSFCNKFDIKTVGYVLKLICCLLILIWPLLFFSIYTKDHTRVAASKWIYKNIQSGAIILSEYWDDGLPLPLEEGTNKYYTGIALPVFDPDDASKWEKMDKYLTEADYYILSSNRGWGSIPTVPEKYPRMSQFYKDLFNDKTNYVKVKEFTSYPSLKYLGIPWEVNTDEAEEAFTVYDHPKVMIYKRL